MISLGAFSQEWIRYYGSEGFYCFPRSVVENYDKGYILLGNMSDYKHLWIIKTDINGNILWDKTIGGGDYTIANCWLTNTADDGIIISGSWTKYGGQMDAVLIKLNSCGELEWCTDFNTSNVPDDGGNRASQTPDEGYILLGAYNDYNGNIHRIHLFKFDSAGTLEWHKFYLPDSLGFGDDATNLMVDSAGIIVTGSIYFPMPGQPGGWIRPYFIRTDLDGNELWSTIYTDGGDYIGDTWETVRDKNGAFYSAGRHNAGFAGENPGLIKLNPDGSSNFNKDLIENATGGDATTILQIHDSVLIIHGGWTIPNQDTIRCGVIRSDTLGNVIKTKKLPVYSRGWSSAKTFNDKLLFLDHAEISGQSIMALSKLNMDLEYDSVYTYPYVYDSLCPGGVVSDTIDPDCNLIVNIDEPLSNPETTQLKVFPNPANGIVTIEMPKYLVVSENSGAFPSTTIYHHWESTTLEAYDINGQKVYSRKIVQSTGTVQLDVSHWPRGMYMVRLVFRNQTAASVKVVVE
jgi:hypothetical protein